LLGGLLWGLLTSALAIHAAADSPEPHFSAAGLAAIQAFMDDAVAVGRIPSAQAMLAIDDRVVWQGTAGEMAPGVPMREDAIMPLASVGKLFTAVAAMILVERGAIALDDPVSRYLPEFTDVRIAVVDAQDSTRLEAPARPITIYHLLTHTSGLTVSGDEFWAAWDANTDLTTAHLARALAKLPLVAQPGERFEYGPTGAAYEVLAAVIEVASGQTLEAFMFENIFEPLGLQDTFFFVPAERATRWPAQYRMVDGAMVLVQAYADPFPRSTFFHGGGGVASAPRDILRFAQLFLHQGSVDGVRILAPQSVAMMMSDQVGEKSTFSDGLRWGFGASVLPAESGPPLYYGWVGGGYAILWVKPRLKLVAYFAFPLTPPGDHELLREFERLVDAASEAP